MTTQGHQLLACFRILHFRETVGADRGCINEARKETMMPFSVFLNACLGAILVGGVSAYLVYVLGARLVGEDRIPMMVLIAVAAGSASITFFGLFALSLASAGE